MQLLLWRVAGLQRLRLLGLEEAFSGDLPCRVLVGIFATCNAERIDKRLVFRWIVLVGFCRRVCNFQEEFLLLYLCRRTPSAVLGTN